MPFITRNFFYFSRLYIYISENERNPESYTKFTLKSSLFQEHLFKFKRRLSIKHPMLVFKNKK